MKDPVVAEALASRLYLFATVAAGLLAVAFVAAAFVQFTGGRRLNGVMATVAAVTVAGDCLLLAFHEMPVWLMVLEGVAVLFLLRWLDPEEGLPWMQR